MPSILKSFFSARAGQINQHALLPQVKFQEYMSRSVSCHVAMMVQALQHVSNLEEEGLLSKEAASKLMVMLQEIIKF